MLDLWDAIEADFLRDYQILLVERLDDITWRLFMVLLHNLNPYGAVAMRTRAEMEESKNETNEEMDEQAANAFFSSIVSM